MKIIFLLFCCTVHSISVAQQAMSFEEAKEKGIYPLVEERYKSAIHSDTSKAVFKTLNASDKHIAAYKSFLSDFGLFLNSKKFYWEDNTRCFNRIYINATIDYFLYHFKTLSEDKD